MKNILKSFYLLIAICVIAFFSLSNNCKASKPNGSNRLKYEINQLDKKTRLKIQQDRLKEITEMAKEQRAQIEKDYSYRLSESLLWSQNFIDTIEISNRLIWIELLKSYRNLSYTDSYSWIGDFLKSDNHLFHSLPIRWSNRKKRGLLRKRMSPHKLISKMLVLYADGITPDFLFDEDAFEQGEKPIRDRETFTVSDIRKVERLFAAMKDFESKSTRLENQKKLYLADIDRWEKNQKENIHAIIKAIKSNTGTANLGVVSAICIDKTGAFCMVEGAKESLLTVGSKINNVEITAIHPNKVEFRKKHQTWVQKIGVAADPAWL
jgi:hypothetical protein